MNLLVLNQQTDPEDPGLGVAVDWLGAFARRVDRLYVITHQAGRLPEIPNLHLFSMGKERGYGRIRRLIEFYRALLIVLRDAPIDGCFVHMVPLLGVLASPLLKLKRIPMVQWYVHKATPWPLRLGHRLVTRVATASRESFRLPSRKVVVTGHGIDTEYFSPPPTRVWPHAPFTVVSVGRLAPIKRLEILVEGVAELRRGASRCQLLLVGGPRTEADRQYEASLRLRIEELGLDASVQLIGPVIRDRIVSWLWRSDVFVNLSETESLDKAVLEAMSCGLPIVTSNSAFRPVLGDLAGQLMVPRNDPAALADVIRAIAHWTPEQRDRVGWALRQIVVERHSLDGLAVQILAIFAEASSHASRPVRADSA